MREILINLFFLILNKNKIQNPGVSAVRGEGYIESNYGRKSLWVDFEDTLYFCALIFRAQGIG